MLIVGLTGGIGSGKSTVADLFAEKGINVIDADVAARELTHPDQPAFQKIIKHFGSNVLNKDGSLNRAYLRNIIFSDQKQRVWLERLLHPLIRQHMEEKLSHITSPYCIAVVPLLLEVESYSFINRILVIDTPESLQVKRVMARDHMSEDELEAILDRQASREQRRLKAHDVINNEGSLAELRKQVDVLHQQYLALA